MGFNPRWASAVLTVALAVTGMQAQDSPSAPQGTTAGPRGGQTDDAVRANALYQAQDFVGALPLYEGLHARHPKEVLWDERLAMCLLGAAHAHPDAEAVAMRSRAHQLLLEAKAGGDNSALLQTVLEKLEAPAAPAGPVSPGMDAFNRAEKAFSAGDLPGALKLYEESAATDPKFYEAPLEAGDTECKRGNFAAAGTWFARAIAINPNRETAYRYWGDCLMKAGDPVQAEGKFIDAVIAEPYTKTTRLGLQQWANLTKTPLSAPAIKLPPRAKVNVTGTENNYITSETITIPKTAENDPMAAGAMAYSLGTTMWQQTGMFKKTYPTETAYRHSLGEEAQSIRVGLSALAKQNILPEKMDATWKALYDLDKDGMLECWILLDHADQGIAQDYVAYRAAHRDVLHAYIAKYDVHPK